MSPQNLSVQNSSPSKGSSVSNQDLGLPRLFSISEVQFLVGGKSRSTIYRWVANGSFPEPVRTGGNSIAWPEEAILDWRESVIRNRAH